MRSAAFLLLIAALAARSARAAGEPAGDRVLVKAGDTWRYATGDDPPPASWLEPGFDDASWREGASGFGYGDDDDATVLADMKGRHVAVYLRRAFEASAADAAAGVTLVVRSDDGFVAWLNGREIARARLEGSPPAASALASDHEATRDEEFHVPIGVLEPGRNMLCVQAHNSSPDSSDFSIEPQLLVRPAIAAPMPVAATKPSRRAARYSMTVASYRIGNYFQGRAGSPEEDVWGQVLRGEARVRPGSHRVRLTFRGEVNRTGDLGTSVAASAAAAWSWKLHDVRVEAGALWNRPAFRLASELAAADHAGIEAGWTFRAPKDVAVSAWLTAARERLELDARRDNEDVLVGVSARFRRDSDAFSPEIGFEADRRRAGAPDYEYDQCRVFLRLRSRPVERVALSALLRQARRDYNTGREDRRRLARLTCDVSLRDAVTFVSFVAWEDGQSSRDSRAFEGTTAWLGLRWSP